MLFAPFGCTHPPSCPTLFACAEPKEIASPKEIAECDIIKLKVLQ